MEVMQSRPESSKAGPNQPTELAASLQFLLEYIHAVLASDSAPTIVTFDEQKCQQLISASRKLREQALLFAMMSSAGTKNREFGPHTAEIEFQAKSAWVTLRGNRYPVLEEEFYSYVLNPHTDTLNEVYGATARDIATGFQEMANAVRLGQANAIIKLKEQFHQVKAISSVRGIPLEVAAEAWNTENPEASKALSLAMDDLLRGGICNVSRHTKLPPKVLADLAYLRGEAADFFSDGDFAGTPFNTLPARKKPLIKIGSDYYAVDPCFIRDAGYRAVLFSLLQNKPEYKSTFEERQKTMSERAFPDILTDQIPGAEIYHEIYYKDVMTQQWSENDTLILIDDMLYLIEAKAGAAATIASPALDFKRHVRTVEDLILKAYKQCKRFFDYLSAADEVPIYRRINGRYEECARIRRCDYRVMVPIGLTVESLAPLSSFCKELPEIEPLAGGHAFVSLSIDDLFVLRRFLPAPGLFAHYIEVRQAVAQRRGALLFDEVDHLGAYLTKNRIDLEIDDHLQKDRSKLILWEGMSDVIDRSFNGANWELNAPPSQPFPEEVTKLLSALDFTRAPGWLLVGTCIRNYNEQARNDLDKALSTLGKSLENYPARFFALATSGQLLFIWMQNSTSEINWQMINDKSSAAALSAPTFEAIGVIVTVANATSYLSATRFEIHRHQVQTAENSHIFIDAQQMKLTHQTITQHQPENRMLAMNQKRIGRNELCPCGSSIKYKRCHGR